MLLRPPAGLQIRLPPVGWMNRRVVVVKPPRSGERRPDFGGGRLNRLNVQGIASVVCPRVYVAGWTTDYRRCCATT